MWKNEKNKTKYKLLLVALRCIPVILSVLYITYAVTNYFGLSLAIICTLSKMSIIVWVFMHLASMVFKFCIYHRSFVYYLFITNMTNFLHHCCNINIIDYRILLLCYAIVGIVLLILLINHVKNHKKLIEEN